MYFQIIVKTNENEWNGVKTISGRNGAASEVGIPTYLFASEHVLVLN